MSSSSERLSLALASESKNSDKLNPSSFSAGFNLESVRLHPFYAGAEDTEHYLEGLRRAGVSEFKEGLDPSLHAGPVVKAAELQQWLQGSAFHGVAPFRDKMRITLMGDSAVSIQIRRDIAETGAAWLEGDRLCMRFAAATRGRAGC